MGMEGKKRITSSQQLIVKTVTATGWLQKILTLTVSKSQTLSKKNPKPGAKGYFWEQLQDFIHISEQK